MLVALVAAPGCGRSLPAGVSGQVILDGKPLATGLVTFFPTTAGPVAYAAIGSDGRYAAQTGSTRGLEPGEYVVTVAANGPPGSTPAPPPPPAAAGNRPRYTEPMLPIITPPKYATRDTTPLRATVKPGGQTLDFELRSQP